LERAGVSRSAAMAMVKTMSFYSRYAIVAEQDLREAGLKLARLHAAPSAPSRKLVSLRCR
jgi:hypothetical protein